MAERIIRIPVDLLQDTAKQLREYANENEDIFDRIYNSLTALNESGEWLGPSVKAATVATQKNKTKFQSTVHTLNYLADQMQKLADEMEAKDLEYVNSINTAADWKMP